MAAHPITVLSLFSGIGGLDLGVHAALRDLGHRPRTVAYLEGEAYAAAVLAARMEGEALDAAPIWSDVTTFDGRPWRGLVDCVIGGFPCQDLSVVGKQAGIDGERSGLWSHMARIIGEVRPRFVFAENVSGLLANAAMRRVLGDLSALGFDAGWGSIRASDVGAPHRRERIFLLAYARRGAAERRREPGAVPRAARGTYGEGHQRQRSGHAASDSGAGVGQADAESRGLGVRGESSGGAGQPAWGNEAVAYSHPAGRSLERSGGLLDGERPALGHDVDRCDGEGLADAPGRGAPAGEQRGQPRGAQSARADMADVRAEFPPGPDSPDWPAIIERWLWRAPALEPCIRRGADGPTGVLDAAMLHRVDRLRALGNAVVPAQARAAFVELWGRMSE